MIVAYDKTSNTSNDQHFENILSNTVDSLTFKAEKKPKYYIDRAGTEFEKDVCKELKLNSSGTPFKNKFKMVSGQRFPDIIAQLKKKNGYGIEVKTSKQNHWTTTGNSILEGSREDGIQRIYIFFGKLFKPIEFRCRRYEDCLYDVAVTHSPRYLIDMKSKKTIFDKLNITYDKLRKQENTIQPIKNYYRKNLKEGEALWWIDEEPENANNLIITPWSQISNERTNYIRNEGMALFPEVFSNSTYKFNRFGMWLITRNNIFKHNIRDTYTAGGQVKLRVNNRTYHNIPHIFYHLPNNVSEIVDIINGYDSEELFFNWGVKAVKDRVKKWINLVNENSKSSLTNSKLKISELISERLGNNA